MHVLFLGWDTVFLQKDLCLVRTFLVSLVFSLCLYFFDLYDLDVYSSLADTATRMTQAFGFGCIILAGIYYLVPSSIIPPEFFCLAIC